MRRILTLGLCALYLAFGSVAGLAHMHGAAGHHERSRGLHVDHAHLDHADDHEHPGHDEDNAGVASPHADHNKDDAVDVDAAAARWLPNVRVLPAIASVGPAIDRPSLMRETWGDRPGQPRDPPKKFPPRLRAPPA